jgi:ATP-dependent Clp endopeptidase proteolytic subunit ClpP
MIIIDGLKANKVRNYAKKSVIDGVFAVKDTELQIYDEIGYFGVTAKAFTKELNALDGKDITVAINSFGGDVFDGIAIYNALKAHKGAVKVRIDGIAASIASIIAMAGDSVEMADNAFLMIHNAWTLAYGNKEDMRTTANMLEQIDGALNDTYRKKTGKKKDDISAMMDAETWLDANAALDGGFIDAIIDNSVDISACFDVSIFNNTPAPIKRNIEANLREKGYGNALAKAAVVEGFDILRERDVPELLASHRDDDVGILVGDLNNLVAFIKNIT